MTCCFLKIMKVKNYLNLLLENVRVNSLSNTYNENKSIRFKTPTLRSNLCDYSDAYILVKVQLRLRLLELIIMQII